MNPTPHPCLEAHSTHLELARCLWRDVDIADGLEGEFAVVVDLRISGLEEVVRTVVLLPQSDQALDYRNKLAETPDTPDVATTIAIHRLRLDTAVPA